MRYWAMAPLIVVTTLLLLSACSVAELSQVVNSAEPSQVVNSTDSEYANYKKEATDAFIALDYRITDIGLTLSEYHDAITKCADKLAQLVSRYSDKPITQVLQSALDKLTNAGIVWKKYSSRLDELVKCDAYSTEEIIITLLNRYSIPITQKGLEEGLMHNYPYMLPRNLLNALWADAHSDIEKGKSE